MAVVGLLAGIAVMRQAESVGGETPSATLQADVLPGFAPGDPVVTFRIGQR